MNEIFHGFAYDDEWNRTALLTTQGVHATGDFIDESAEVV
jgi:hypothetical protein